VSYITHHFFLISEAVPDSQRKIFLIALGGVIGITFISGPFQLEPIL